MMDDARYAVKVLDAIVDYVINHVPFPSDIDMMQVMRGSAELKQILEMIEDDRK